MKESEQVFSSVLTYHVVLQLFSETFNALPLAHLIKNKILVVHGGLFSKDDVTLDDIRNIDRIKLKQPGAEGVFFFFVIINGWHVENMGEDLRRPGKLFFFIMNGTMAGVYPFSWL